MTLNEFDPRHPHEPELAPIIDPEGRCLVCSRLYLTSENERLARQLLAAQAPIDTFTTYLYGQTQQLAANAEGDAEPCGWNVHAEVESIRTFWINLVDKHDAWHLAEHTETPG